MVSTALWVVAATAVLSYVVAGLAWRRRPNQGARSFAIGMTGIAWWLTCMFAGHSIEPVHATVATLLYRLEALGAAVLAMYWFRFALEYTGRGEYVTRRLMALLWAFPVGGVPVALGATQYLELYASWLGVEATLPVWDVWPVYKSIGFVYLYVLLGAGFVSILGLVLDRRLPRPELASLWLVAAFVPMAVGWLSVTGVFRPLGGLDPTPFGFVVTGLVGLAAITQYDVFQSGPVARNYVVDRLEAGTLVYDDSRRLVDYNEWAGSVLGLDDGALGREVGGIIADATDESVPVPVPDRDGAASDDLDPRAFAEALDGEELTVTDGDGTTHLSVDVAPLERPAGGREGYAVLLYDVTARREYRRELERQNEQLERLADVVSHDLRNPLDVGMGQARRLRSALEVIDDAGDDAATAVDVDFERLDQRAADVLDAMDRRQRHPGRRHQFEGVKI